MHHDKMQCHFNWNLEKIDNSHTKDILERMEMKLRDKELLTDTPFINKWTLMLSQSYELFKVDNITGIEKAEEAIKEAENSNDPLFLRYKTSFLHVARSLLVLMCVKSDREVGTYEATLGQIKPYDAMDNIEKSGIIGVRTNVLRWYGPEGNKQGLSLIRKAILLNPSEFEWKISLVILLNRSRHFNRSRKLSWADVREPVELLEELIRSRDRSREDRVSCQYFLAVIYRDLILDDPKSESAETLSPKVLKLCNEIHRSKVTKNPMVVSFCAQQIARGGDIDTAKSIIEEGLERFPRHIQLNTAACHIYKYQQMYDKIFERAKIAYEEGGYGAAWIYLDCMCRRNMYLDLEQFFQDLIKNHSRVYAVQIHVGAALFYFYNQRSIVKGCLHMEKALQINPSYENINDTYNNWSKERVNPLDVTYNQTLVGLQAKNLSDEDESILRRVQRMIEVQTDVTRMNVCSEIDLVEQSMRRIRQPRRSSSSRRGTPRRGRGGTLS